jgi:pyruvate/2-oxoglutarate dehydrogenase complex dihydrolipoamide dehydrogenase (E3) component
VEQIGGDKVENIADVDKVLLAIGRSPNTEELNLPAVVSTRGVCYLWHFFF